VNVFAFDGCEGIDRDERDEAQALRELPEVKVILVAIPKPSATHVARGVMARAEFRKVPWHARIADLRFEFWDHVAIPV
jgi:hypothetical protein